MFAPPPRQLLYVAYKLEVSFANLYTGQEKYGSGTAFLLASGPRPILVTNRHVVDIDYSAQDNRYKDFRLSQLIVHGRTGEDKAYQIALDCTKEFIFPKDRENDVACLIDFSGSGSMPSANFQMYHHLTVQDLATEDDFLTSIWPGDLVFFSGYPATHDKLDNRPILRSGVIASDPRFNYSNTGIFEGDRVAYEAMSTPGSSGSPVYSPARGYHGGQFSRGNLLVGINAGHIQTEFGSHSGMSYFIKSTVIRQMLSENGVSF